MPSEEKQVGAFVARSSPYRYEVNEKSDIPTKNPESIHLWSNQFWNPIANVSVKVQNEKTST